MPPAATDMAADVPPVQAIETGQQKVWNSAAPSFVASAGHFEAVIVKR